MNKQKIITNTAIFIFVMVFVLIFKSIFGEENTFIGISTITATLMLLGRDFTGEPLKNTLKFVGVNVLIGIGSYLAVKNVWLAIPVNFIVVFTFSYIFTYNLRNPLYFPFGLQYLFLLSTPVAEDKLYIRFLALICGALIIMLPQLLVNRNKLTTAGNKILIGVCDSIVNKVKSIKEKSSEDNSNNNINTSIDEFRTIVYDKREDNYYLSEEAKIKLNMSVALENINSMLYREDSRSIDLRILDILEEIVGLAKDTLKFNHKKDKELKKRNYDMQEILNYCERKGINDLVNLQLLESMIFLDETIDGLSKLDKKDYRKINKISEKNEIISQERVKNILKGKNSPKYCYAMRMAISVTIGAFIMGYFKLEEGRWILFTILSLTNPIYETAKSKIKDRLLATLIGSVIIIAIFSIFKNQNVRLLIVLLTGCLQSYINQYKYRMIFVTVAAIGTAAAVGNVQELTVERIIMVIIGTIIAIIANRYIFPYNLKDSNTQLRKLYDASIKEMFEEIDELLKGNVRPEIMNNLFVITSLVESKSRVNKQIDDDKIYNEIVNERRNLISNIYELYRWIRKGRMHPKEQEKIINDMRVLIQYRDEDIEGKIIKIENAIKETENINTRITLSTIILLLKSVNRLKELNKLKEKAQV